MKGLGPAKTVHSNCTLCLLSVEQKVKHIISPCRISEEPYLHFLPISSSIKGKIGDSRVA